MKNSFKASEALSRYKMDDAKLIFKKLFCLLKTQNFGEREKKYDRKKVQKFAEAKYKQFVVLFAWR